MPTQLKILNINLWWSKVLALVGWAYTWFPPFYHKCSLTRLDALKLTIVKPVLGMIKGIVLTLVVYTLVLSWQLTRALRIIEFNSRFAIIEACKSSYLVWLLIFAQNITDILDGKRQKSLGQQGWHLVWLWHHQAVYPLAYEKGESFQPRQRAISHHLLIWPSEYSLKKWPRPPFQTADVSTCWSTTDTVKELVQNVISRLNNKNTEGLFWYRYGSRANK